MTRILTAQVIKLVFCAICRSPLRLGVKTVWRSEETKNRKCQMSKQAIANARKLKRSKGMIRVIICEEAFDYQFGETLIAVKHPQTNISFALNRSDIDDSDHLALRRAIWAKATTLIKQIRNKQAPPQEETAKQQSLFNTSEL